MTFKDIKISKQIVISSGLMILLVIILEGFSLYNSNSLWENTREMYDHPFTVQQTLAKIQADVFSIQSEMGYLLYNSSSKDFEERLTMIDTFENDIYNQLDVLYSAYLGPRSDIDDVYKSLVEYKEIRNENISHLRTGETDEAITMGRFDGIAGLKVKVIFNELTEIKEFAKNKAAEFYNNAQKQKNLNFLQLFFLFLSILVLSVTIILLFRKRVLRPLNDLTAVTDEFKRGNMDVRSAYESKNELGMLSEAFNDMAGTVQSEMQYKEKFANELLDFQNNLETLVDQKTEELVSANILLLKSEERYKAITQTSMDGFFVIDIKGVILEVNDAYCMISGYSRKELLGMNISDLGYHDSTDQTAAYIRKITFQGKDQFDSKHRMPDGSFFYVHNSMTYIPNEEIIICFVNDITERRKSEEKVLYLSYHDHLTGLYNYRFYHEELLKLDNEKNLPLSIVMGDVNGLKAINDSIGHAAGNELLKKAAEVLKKNCRDNDVIARIGGDEFIIILPRTDFPGVMKIIGRVESMLSEEKVGDFTVSISFGYATKSIIEENINDTFKTAENLMYENKKAEKARTAESKNS
ncbi:MAG: diguanylate cyclase [Saccharofermentanales bacterium]